MILKPEDMQAVCDNFIHLVFEKAWDQFREWVAEEICPTQTKLTGSPHFHRNRKVWPGDMATTDRMLVVPMHDKFDAEYDKLRQMVDIEGNYYVYWIRDAVALAENWEDVKALMPEQALQYLWVVGVGASRCITDADVLKFQSKHKIALDYFKRRMTFYSLGVNRGLI